MIYSALDSSRVTRTVYAKLSTNRWLSVVGATLDTCLATWEAVANGQGTATTRTDAELSAELPIMCGLQVARVFAGVL